MIPQSLDGPLGSALIRSETPDEPHLHTACASLLVRATLYRRAISTDQTRLAPPLTEPPRRLLLPSILDTTPAARTITIAMELLQY